MKIKSTTLKKFCAIITTVCFIFTIVSNNLFASFDVNTMKEQQQLFNDKDNEQINSLFLDKYGKVSQSKNNLSSTVVVNIQDLHCDYSVQKNICSIIKELDKNYKISKIYVEGGYGTIDLSLLDKINPKFKDTLIENLLKEAKITASEYYALKTNNEDKLHGVENKDVYLKNIERLKNIVSNKEKNLKYLANIEKEIDILKTKYLSNENKELSETILNYEKGNISQDLYFKSLIEYSKQFKINIKNYKNMLSYLGLSDENNTINYDNLKKEIVKTVNELKNNLSYDQFATVSKLTNDFQNISEFKKVIEKYNKEYEKDILKNTPNLETYINLKEKMSSFNPLELVKEEKNLVNAIRTFLSKNKTELEIAYLSDFEKYFKGYVLASLTPAQWNYLKVGIEKFKELYSKYSISNDVYKMQNQFAQLDKFYETNDYRNEIFVKNMNLSDNVKSDNMFENSDNSERILSNAKEIVVLVSGGYHTSGINDILNKKGISNITIMPNVAGSNSLFSKEKYDNIAKLIEQQKIALPLMANATQKEQILNIVDVLLDGENANGITVSMLVDQLNKLFAGEISVKNETQDGKIKFEYKDGNVVVIDVDDEISKMTEEHDVTKGHIEQLKDNKLKEIVNEVYKATFNFGQEVFAPQIYQVSKDACIFMVNNKWYIGDGVIWDIANSKYNGKSLDGVEPVVYEYMPDWMQLALLSKEESNGGPTSFDLAAVQEQLTDKKVVLQGSLNADVAPGKLLFSEDEIFLFKKGEAVLTIKIQDIKNVRINEKSLKIDTTDSSYEFEIISEGKEGEYKKIYFYKEIDSLDISSQDKEKYKEAIDDLDLVDYLDFLEVKSVPLSGKDLLSKLDEWLSSNVTEISQASLKDKNKKTVTVLKKQAGKIFRKVLTLVLVFAMTISIAACGLRDDIDNEPTYPTEIELTQENKDFNNQISEYLDSFYVGNGQYRSFLYEKMPEFYKNNTVNKDTLRNIENLYDQSLVALSYMQMGQLEEADKVLGAINNSDYLYKSNVEYQQTTGEIVWVGIAAVQYKLLTGSTKYDSLITKVDDHLNRVRKYDGSYYGELVYSWISTEHMLDVVAYYNLKTLYDDSDEVKTRLEQAANYLYENLYNEQDGAFRRGFEDEHYVLDTCSWGVQVLLSLKAVNPTIYYNSSISNIDVKDLLEYAEDNFKTKIHYEGETYENLYKWSAESTSPVSFEWTMEMAVTYRMMGEDEKADAILKDVLDYSKALGIEEGYIAYADQNEVRNYFMAEDGGWLVYVIPAVCTTVGQRVQIEYNSFYMPMTKSSEFSYVIENDNYQSMSFAKMQGENWKVYSTKGSVDLSNAKNITFQLSLVNYVPDAKVKIQFLPTNTASGQNLEGSDFGLYEKVYTFDESGKLTIDISMEDFEMETFGTTSQNALKQMLMDLSNIKIIISAGETCFGEELNSTKLNIEIENIQIQYNDDTQIDYKPITFSQGVEEYESEEETSAILPETYRYINKLIHDGVFSIRKALMEILGNETVESLFNPVGFVNAHLQTKGAIILTVVTAFAFIAAFGVLLYMGLPAVLAILESFAGSVFANVATHLIIDYRYLKSSGLKEAINLYGNKNVSLNEKGVQIKNKEKSVPLYVINDKPKNVKDFNFKSVPVKFKNSNGKIVRGWMGQYNGATVLFAEGVNYQNIAQQFSQTKQFQTLSGINANVDIIEVDLSNKDKELSYSENGNPLVGVNLIKTNNVVDIQKEAALLNNKKVEAITINQNIAVYIDDLAESVSTSNDMLNAIDMYVESDGLGTNAKILFTDSYIDRIIGLLETELGSKEAAQTKFISMIKQLKEENKEISVVFEQTDKNTNLEKYFDYGLFTYIANGEYVDSISSTKSRIKMVSDLNKIEGFDGSLSVLRVSAFKDEIAKTSGIFAFLNSSLNIKEIMEKRSIEFVKQVAGNFDFNQIPNIDVDILANILTQYENKFTVLSKYLQEADSISMYYKGLSSEKEQEVFVNAILERMIVVNYLRSLEEDKAYYGLKDKNLENVLSRALVEKYKQQNTFEINSNASIDENLMASEVELELDRQISKLTQRAFEQNDPQAIDDIIKLIPLYADRGTGFRTQEIKIMEIQNIKGILSAA